MTKTPAQGILPYQQITRLITSGAITSSTPIEDRQIQPDLNACNLGANPRVYSTPSALTKHSI